MKKFLSAVLCVLFFITISFFTNCASTTYTTLLGWEKGRIEKAEFTVKTINDWNYEITGLDNVNNVYILKECKKKDKKQDRQEYLAYLNNNVSIESHGVKYSAKFLGYDKIKYHYKVSVESYWTGEKKYRTKSSCLYIEKYQLIDANGKPLSKKDMVTIKQKRRKYATNSDSAPIVSPYVAVEQQHDYDNWYLTLKINDGYDALKYYGREENYTDCYILLWVLDGDTEEEGEAKETKRQKKELAEKIINKKYPTYFEDKKRTSLENFKANLHIYIYTSGDIHRKVHIPFKNGDVIEVSKNEFYILDFTPLISIFNYILRSYKFKDYRYPYDDDFAFEVNSDFQFRYNSNGRVSEKLYLQYKGKSSYIQNYSVVECDSFYALNKDEVAEYEKSKNKLEDEIKAIYQNPETYKSILDK